MAAAETTPACADVSSAPAATWLCAAESCSDEDADCLGGLDDLAISARSRASAPSSAPAISPSSSAEPDSGATVRSPRASASTERFTATTARSTPAETSQPEDQNERRAGQDGDHGEGDRS